MISRGLPSAATNVATALLLCAAGFAAPIGVANASPFCYDTGPGYQKCIDSPSGDYFNPTYQGPKVYYGGDTPGYYPGSPSGYSPGTNPIGDAIGDAVANALLLQFLNQRIQDNMQGYFDDPANGVTQYALRVGRVALQKTGDTSFEGVVAVSTGEGAPQDFPVHVTSDGTNTAWSLDPGVLLPLFQ
ncbi:hypothetical protein [Mycobacterium sp. M26]|uniref:hypothetical protein n=1 Tax=Mycobacterium sp. M26 TaxID=1762962 RepID=UPI00073E3B81|nr:hypothetical protein [Mycobacterium sp. M26]